MLQSCSDKSYFQEIQLKLFSFSFMGVLSIVV